MWLSSPGLKAEVKGFSYYVLLRAGQVAPPMMMKYIDLFQLLVEVFFPLGTNELEVKIAGGCLGAPVIHSCGLVTTKLGASKLIFKVAGHATGLENISRFNGRNPIVLRLNTDLNEFVRLAVQNRLFAVLTM